MNSKTYYEHITHFKELASLSNSTVRSEKGKQVEVRSRLEGQVLEELNMDVEWL